jgi:hypothetical protein
VTDTLDIVLKVVLIALAASAAYGVWVAVGTLRSVRELADDVDERLVPLIERATETLDSVDREMARVDGIVTRFEDVSDTVSATTRVASRAVRAPLVRLAGVSGGLKALFTGLRRR